MPSLKARMDAAMAGLEPTAADPGRPAPAPPVGPPTLPPAAPRPPTPPRKPVDVATVLIAVGRTCIALGLLIFGFVGYELLGTNLAESRHQSALRPEARAILGKGASAPLVEEVTQSQPNTSLAPPPAPEGNAVAVIKIPRIGVEKTVVEGVGLPDLKKGPGHYPGTPLPGQPGNAAIAGHRTTYGAPFFRINELQVNDPIFITTPQGAFRYEVERTDVVKPTDVEVVGPLDGAHLTLTSCNPRFSAKERFVVRAKLVGPAAAAPVTKTVSIGEVPKQTGPANPIEVVGAVSDPTARVPTALYGALAAAVALGGWFLSRRWKRWPAYAVTALPFLVALFFFYANLSRLIPS